MEDKDGPKVADAFYRHLFQASDKNSGHTPDTTQAAQALHLAVKMLKEQDCSFKRWVPYIHLGL
jgi:hypothetical protein